MSIQKRFNHEADRTATKRALLKLLTASRASHVPARNKDGLDGLGKANLALESRRCFWSIVRNSTWLLCSGLFFFFFVRSAIYFNN